MHSKKNYETNLEKRAALSIGIKQFPALARYLGQLEEEQDLPPPVLDRDPLMWIDRNRPMVGGQVRNFNLTPFWPQVYEDNHPNIMLVNARQTFKTTFCTDMVANYATSRPISETCYVTDNEAHLSAMSKQRMRIETFQQNPILRQFLRHDRANIGEISLRNDSTVYLVTDEGEYKKVEGKSLQLLILDEAQYQDVQFLAHAMYAMFKTHGRLYVLGIGGEAGSEYWKMWDRTDQRNWIYDDLYWRDKLTFDNIGNISNSDTSLKATLAGQWIPQKPENTQYRGYHMPQEIFAYIPLTIEDAIMKYKTNPEFSIEHQRKHYPNAIYVSHALGEFYKAERRPVTPEMVKACMEPYRYLSLLKPEEVVEIKQLYGNEVRILMGVDFGSGPVASSTVASILIHWRKSARYQLAWIEKRPQEQGLDQSAYLAYLGKAYNIDIGVGDLGYGQDRVKLIQDGGRDSNDKKFTGLRKSIFYGCRTIGDETKPEQEYLQDTDEHGTELGRFQIDKTTAIQEFVDFIDWKVAHPKSPSIDDYKRPKLIIPFMHDYEVDWLINDFCAITRKDLEQDPDIVIEDPRQKPRKEFNHPRDSVMAIIYALVGDKHFSDDAYHIFGTKN